MDDDNRICVSFQNFWPGFSPYSFFVPLVEAATKREVHVTKPSKSDLAFYSVFKGSSIFRSVARRISFGKNHDLNSDNYPPKPGQKRIWFTGENQRPPIADYDLSLSFDVDPLGGTNTYLPLILTHLDWFQDGQQQLSLEGKRAGVVVTPDIAKMARPTNVSERKRFLCAFIGNVEPIRMRALEALSSYGEVDIYGSAVGRPVPSKILVAREYRFMLCFENDLYPGYVTEKPLDAWMSGCIPLWRGLDQHGVLNPDSIINAASFDSLESFVQMVTRVDKCADELSRIGSKPLISGQASLSKAIEALHRITIS